MLSDATVEDCALFAAMASVTRFHTNKPSSHLRMRMPYLEVYMTSAEVDEHRRYLAVEVI